jgi:hypothetical protein
VASWWLAPAIVALAPSDVPRVADIAINLPVAAFTFAVVLLTALLCALAPARHVATGDVTDSLNDGARATDGRRSIRVRSALLVFQGRMKSV